MFLSCASSTRKKSRSEENLAFQPTGGQKKGDEKDWGWNHDGDGIEFFNNKNGPRNLSRSCPNDLHSLGITGEVRNLH